MTQNTIKVLIADDEEPIRSLLQTKARRLGLQPEAVATGDDALQLLQSEAHFDLVISDYKMPGMNGLDLFKETRKLAHRRHVTLVLFSGFLQDALRAELVYLRAGFIQKPALAEDVFAQALAHLGR